MNTALSIVTKSLINAGLIASTLGALSVLFMWLRSTSRTVASKASRLDALFLAFSSPGFSRFSFMNSPDTLGVGIYAALALEQIGAIDDLKAQVDVNLQLYRDWPEVYLSAARYAAITGDHKKAQDYLVVGKTLLETQAKLNFPQLEVAAIEAIILQNVMVKNVTTIDASFNELGKNLHLRIFVKSLRLTFIGGCVLAFGIVLHMVRSFIR